MSLIARLIVVFVIGILSACAGGTAGTGTRTVEGSVRDSKGQPLSGVTVTSESTETSTVTDSQGNFSFESVPTESEIVLQVEGPNLDSSVVIENLAEADSTLHVELALDSDSQVVQTDNVEVTAEIVGDCDLYFENGRVIRQANKTPPGIECLAKVGLRINGLTFGNVPFVIQYRACDPSADWITTASGLTQSGTHSGIGQLLFQYFDDPEHCVYRVVAPYQYGEVSQVIYEIQTFTAQSLSDPQ